MQIVHQAAHKSKIFLDKQAYTSEAGWPLSLNGCIRNHILPYYI